VLAVEDDCMVVLLSTALSKPLSNPFPKALLVVGVLAVEDDGVVVLLAKPIFVVFLEA
jgi:hypothetical protein